MLKRSLAVLALVLIVVLAACGGSGKDDSASSGEVILKATGSVNGGEVGWTEDDLREMDMMGADYTNKDGETATYTGVSINALLEKAGAKGEALAFVADDGYSAEATLAEVQGCADCIIAFRVEGGLLVVMPGFSSKLQVKGVVEIQVK